MGKDMQLLFITWNYPPKIGGMEMLLSQLVQHLQPYAHVQVIAPYANPDECVLDENYITRPKRNGLLWFFLSASAIGFKFLRRQQYDAIIAGSTLMLPIVYLLGKLFHLPVVVQVYGLDMIYKHPLYQLAVRIFLPRCDAVLAISKDAQKIAVSLGVKPVKVRIITPGLDFTEFAAIPDVTPFKQQQELTQHLVILSAGRLAKRKGIPEFIRYALPQIVHVLPQVVFLVAGDNPSLSLTHKEDIKSRIEAEIQEAGLQKHVRLLGRVERDMLIDLYHACDLFVLPAIYVPGDMEGFGIVLIEASAAGKPVVSTRLGGIPDAVVDGQSGVLVAAAAWEEMAQVIIALLQDGAKRQDLGAFGRQRVMTELDWPIVGKRYAEFLQTVQKGKRPS